MSQIDITTSQNVNISFKLASVGERILAYFLDFLIMVAYLIIISFIMGNFFQYKIFQRLDDWSARAIAIIILLPISFYALINESLMEGQTLGKKVAKIKVVKIDGYQASFSDYLVRWIFRFVDIYLTFGLVGLISMIVSKNNQRLGDIASGTAVISLKNSVNISHTILENLGQDYKPFFPQVIALSDNDMRIIKENFQKAVRTDDRVVIHRLEEKIKEILKLDYDKTNFTQRQFISTIIKDYNFYTGQEN